MKTRFAPSPTGELHLGNLFIALLNALYAYHHQGNFVLRIEDTDQIRSDKKFVSSIAQDLAWFGLKWDPKQTIFQSQRQNIYAKYYEILLNRGLAYPCFCSEERLATLRLQQKMNKQPPGYDGKCANLPTELVLEKNAQKEPYHLRFRIPKRQMITFEDCIKGQQTFRSEVFSDFVIQRSDSSPSFLYCNALDDALTNITHVIRGEDHLSNTARQLLLLNALNLAVPHYGHVPLISMQASNKPLSKRDNSLSITHLRQAGYLPLALLNYLARLSHNLKVKTLLSIEELAKIFSINGTRSSAPHFDIHQLNFWQKQALKSQEPNDFWNTLESTAQILVPHEKKQSFVSIMQDMITFPSEATQWAQVFFIDPLVYSTDMQKTLQDVNPKFWINIITLLEQESTKDTLKTEVLKAYMNNLSREIRVQHWKALRIAITGRFSGPDLTSIINLLGIARTIKRLRGTIAFLNQK